MIDAVVVGAGIVGSTIAKALDVQGRQVMVLDDRRAMSGTRPSGGHLKPSWLGGMKRVEYEPAMELLDRAWGLIEEQFAVYPSGITTTVYRVDTDAVMDYRAEQVNARVQAVSQLHNYPVVHLDNGEDVRCRLLVVAAGVWCAALLPELDIQRKQGVSFRLAGQVSKPFIRPWAPYKQVVAHQQGPDEIWVGDGTAILEKNWDGYRTEECLERCCTVLSKHGLLTGTEPSRTIVGLRPYCKTGSSPCLLQQLGPRSWVATGAGKLGTIAAGWAAKCILERSNGYKA